MMKKLIGLLFTIVFSTANIVAQDWPQFLGPERNSTSPQTGLLRSWPDTGPELLWTTNLGIGYGGPAVKDGKIYLLDRDDQEGDIMRCFDLANGEELWQYTYNAPGTFSFPGSRSVPTVGDNHVYSCGPYGDLYCFDIITGQPVWNRNIWTDFGGEELPTWVISQNPLIYQDLLIVASQTPEAGVVAYNKLTGDLVWKTTGLGNESYVSPSVVKIDGQDQIVMVTSSANNYMRPDDPYVPGNIIGMQPITGEILWKFSGWECVISVPSAVDAGDNKILVVGGYELGAMMIQVEKLADGSFNAKELFRTEEFGDQTKPPILLDGYFYAQYGTNRRRDGLVCMSMDGEIMWKTRRSPDFNKGSMILVDGLILATDGTRSLYLIQPDPSGFKPLASTEFAGSDSGEGTEAELGTQNWAPIALADGKLLIRHQSRMLCVKMAE